MIPERVAELISWWVRFYTRDLPAPTARRRIDEIDSDLHDQIAHERADGTSDRRIALGILSRMARGLAADVAWRRRHAPTRLGAGRVAIATAFVLLVPLLAMQFTDEVAWSPADFAVAGLLLFGAGLTYRLVARRAGTSAYRVAVGLAVAAALLLIWLVGAVGVIGEDGDRADLMYGGVLLVGIVGAVLTRFRPAGMARALLGMGLAQGLVAIIALIGGKHEAPTSSVPELIGLNGIFVALFIGSALLFRRAGRKQAAPGADRLGG
jgi:hypothetical protein